MCVDDYQFRHYSAIKPKQCRRFVFINEDQNQKTFLVNISQFEEDGQVALCKIINHLSSKGLLANKRTFFCPKFNFQIKLGDNCKVPFWALAEKQIIFRASVIEENQEDPISWSGFNNFNCIQPEVSNGKQEIDGCSNGTNQCHQYQTCQIEQVEGKEDKVEKQVLNAVNESPDEESKELSDYDMDKNSEKSSKRSKESERLIMQVLIALKKWRRLYESKKMNLTKAAKLIGISKKSLDDYFLVVRIGEILGFDFQAHLGKKMGHLRTFIKKFEIKIKGKLTKKVKCFEIIPDVDIQQLLKSYQQSEKQAIQAVDEMTQTKKENIE